MKLYSIWWEEEILLMCSCNDCSKRGGKWKGATDGCLHLNSLKEIKALNAHFSAFCCSPALGNGFQILWTQSAANWESPADFTSVKLLWRREAGGVAALWFNGWRMFYQHGLRAQWSVKLGGGGDALPEPVCLIHLQLIRHGNMASTDLVVFPERNNEEST